MGVKLRDEEFGHLNDKGDEGVVHHAFVRGGQFQMDPRIILDISHNFQIKESSFYQTL